MFVNRSELIAVKGHILLLSAIYELAGILIPYNIKKQFIRRIQIKLVDYSNKYDELLFNPNAHCHHLGKVRLTS